MAGERNVPLTWTLKGRTLIFETTRRRPSGVFRCSSCHFEFPDAGLRRAFQKFAAHKCKGTSSARRKSVGSAAGKP